MYDHSASAGKRTKPNPCKKMKPIIPTILRRPLILAWIILPSLLSLACGQIIVDTIEANGASDNRIDILFFGDGYQAAEVTQFNDDVDEMIEYMFDPAAAGFGGERYADPFPRYKKFFNVIRIFEPSVQSGVTTPTDVRQTSLGANFGTPQTSPDGTIRNLAIDSVMGNNMLTNAEIK